VILTVTPNPSIDLLHETEKLVWDDANRVETPRRRAGGQGINLTRAARVLGHDSIAVAFFGGNSGKELQSLLEKDEVNYVAIPIAGDTRVFVAVRETSSGRAMLINPRGPVLGDRERSALIDQVEALCMRIKPDWVVCSGSVPRGLQDDLYAAIAHIAHANDCRFAADCDGAPLELAIEQGCDVIVPNQHEAERLVRAPIDSVQDAAAAARSLLDISPRVLIKLSEQGAVLAHADGCWHARPPAFQQGSAVGAGDAFLAGFLVAEKNGAPPQEALRQAVAAGTAVLRSKSTDLLTRSDYDDVLSDIVVTPL
jgi:1-phosphofructokinase family hexose kinase